jgi:hypothetical protein
MSVIKEDIVAMIADIAVNAANVNQVARNVVGTSVDRIALGITLANIDAGKIQYFDTDDNRPYWWNGTEWV